jgi:hypothetical protein
MLLSPSSDAMGRFKVSLEIVTNHRPFRWFRVINYRIHIAAVEAGRSCNNSIPDHWAEIRLDGFTLHLLQSGNQYGGKLRSPSRCESMLSTLQLAYFLPFYFQAAQTVSATESGVRYLPLVIPQITALVLSGAIATVTGHYVSTHYNPDRRGAQG